MKRSSRFTFLEVVGLSRFQDYLSTFYLFVFDENGDSAGMVRAQIHLDGPDHLTFFVLT